MTDENGNGEVHEDFDVEAWMAAQKDAEKEKDLEVQELFAQFESAREEADARAEQRAIENAAKLEEDRVTRSHEQFLEENGLEHIRQDNDGPEDYSDLPESIHVTMAAEGEESSDLAPPGQQTMPPEYDLVIPPQVPVPSYHISHP